MTTISRVFLCVLYAAMIGGCSDAPTEQVATDPVVVRGEATYAERIALPPDATLEIVLINTTLADSADAVVASLHVDGVGGPPVPFEMKVDAGKFDSRMAYALRASLRDGDGRLRFTSDEAQPVTIGDTAPVVIRMAMVSPGGSSATHGIAADDPSVAQAVPPSSRFRCGDRIVDVELTEETAILRYDEIERVLPRGRSASGARYAQDGDEFWTKAGGASLTLGGDRTSCDVSAETTPWEDAAARGVSVRIVGSEPGWLAEVGSGAAPSLRLLLDHGERELSFDVTTAVDAGHGIRAERDGLIAELRWRDEVCEDPMSGVEYPLSATLVIEGEDRDYIGCGRRLAD